jgi:hypothetical protein
VNLGVQLLWMWTLLPTIRRYMLPPSSGSECVEWARFLVHSMTLKKGHIFHSQFFRPLPLLSQTGHHPGSPPPPGFFRNLNLYIGLHKYFATRHTSNLTELSDTMKTYGEWRYSSTMPRYPLDGRLGGPQSRSGHYGEEKNLFPLSSIELQPSRCIY